MEHKSVSEKLRDGYYKTTLPFKTKSLYELCVEAGLTIDHHESDLYIKDCTAARVLLSTHGQHFEIFLSEVDGVVWLDVLFAYQPYWDKPTLTNIPVRVGPETARTQGS